MNSSKAVFLDESVRRRPARGRLAVLALALLSLGAATAASGETGDAAAREHPPGDLYRRAPNVSREQAQVIYFRAASAASPAGGAAHVYVDGELEGALMPDGYTRFCVRRGAHADEAYIGDAPRYAGKAQPRVRLDLEGGETYFIGVSERGTGEPVRYRRADAERALATSREQTHIVNRASAVVRCRELATAPAIEFEVRAEVLFAFDRSDAASITADGRETLERIATEIRGLPPDAIARVTVLGHADPIGASAYNQALSEARAQTVGEVLSEHGIAPGLIRTVGKGSDEPVVQCPSEGDRTRRIDCNAPNRRVEIKVESDGTDYDA